MKVVKIQPVGFKGWFSELENLKSAFEEAEIGEKFLVTVFEMSQEDFDLLPEFTGP